MSAVFASALVAVSAETVNLTYKDCGSSSTHAKITALKPDSVEVPGKVSIVGSGALDSDQTTAHFSLKVKKGIIPFVSGKGNICEDTTINLPLGAGSFTVKGLECPIKAGNVDIEVDLDLLSADLFEDGENSLLTIHIDANADDTGDQVICLDVDASLAGDANKALQVEGNCDSAPYAFCCGVGTPCDCAKGMASEGQCDSAAYSFCCMVGTKCNCDAPPFANVIV